MSRTFQVYCDRLAVVSTNHAGQFECPACGGIVYRNEMPHWECLRCARRWHEIPMTVYTEEEARTYLESRATLDRIKRAVEKVESEPKRFDVTATLTSFATGGSDGAYGILGKGRTIDEILVAVREQLEQLDRSLMSGRDWVECYLTVSIGPAGSYEELPI